MPEQLALELRCTIGMATGASGLYGCDWCGTLLYVPHKTTAKALAACPHCGRGNFARIVRHQAGPFHRGPQPACARQGCTTCGGARVPR